MQTLFRILSLTLLLPAGACTLFGQTFVSTANEWYATDCCYIFVNGQTDCDTYNYWFSDTVTIDSLPYLLLNSNNPFPLFETGKYYREENGVVFMKRNIAEEEMKIYNFNLTVGEEFTIGNAGQGFSIKVLSIDSVTLNSGEKRKRLNIEPTLGSGFNTFWIEGVGSGLSPMNPVYMFSFDCWNALNCFRENGAVELQIGDCQLTSVENVETSAALIACAPNPAKDHVRFARTDKKPLIRTSITVVDAHGRQVWQSSAHQAYLDGIEWQTDNVPSGVYFYTIRDGDGFVQSGRVAVVR